jgi:hypothetical protein
VKIVRGEGVVGHFTLRLETLRVDDPARELAAAVRQIRRGNRGARRKMREIGRGMPGLIGNAFRTKYRQEMASWVAGGIWSVSEMPSFTAVTVPSA